MEQSNKELMEELPALFQDYEESYVPGEWEAFQKYKKKKTPFFSGWIRAAALFILMLSILTYALKVQHTRKDLYNKKDMQASSTPAHILPEAAKLPQAYPVTPLKSMEKTGTRKIKVKAELLEKKDRLIDKNSLGYDSVNQNIVIAQVQLSPSQEHKLKPAAQVVQTQHMPMDTTIVIPNKKPISTSEFLIAESGKTGQQEKKRDMSSRWDFGLEVMPTVTRTNMSFSAGLVTGFRLSDKLSISSGISIIQLGSGENIAGSNQMFSSANVLAAAPSGRESAIEGERVRANTQLSAIDIPLGLVYRVNKNYYASAGVSYFNVITEQRNNIFLLTQSANKSIANQLTGEVFTSTVLETREVNQSSAEQPLKGNSYLGFFNFSIGRSQQIFKQYNFQVEPFIKVPIGKLSTQEINLFNTGVKFQVAF